MNPRTLLVLAAIAVIAAVLAVVGQRAERGTGGAGTMIGTRFVTDLEASLNDADEVVILTAGGNEAVTLERDGDLWTVAEQDGYPADFGKLRAALTALAEGTVIEEKTGNPDFYDRLAVESIELASAAGTAVRVRAADRELADVILGAESGADGRFARQADAVTSVLIDRNPDFPADPTQWLAPGLVDVRGDRIQRVEISHADGEQLAIAKASRDETTFAVEDIPAGRELQYASIANVSGNALRELQLEGARAATPPSDPVTTTVFRTFDGLVVTVTSVELDGEPWIGIRAAYDAAQAESFALTDGPSDTDDGADIEAEAATINDRVSGWYFRVPTHIHGQMTRRMEDLLQAPAEATDD